MKPYTPLLEEFMNLQYGFNLVNGKPNNAQSTSGDPVFNTELLNETGIVGTFTDPNIIVPSTDPVKFYPVVNQPSVGDDAFSVQIALRHIEANKNRSSNSFESTFTTADPFLVPSKFDFSNAPSVKLPVKDTRQFISLAVGYRTDLKPDQQNKSKVFYGATFSNYYL